MPCFAIEQMLRRSNVSANRNDTGCRSGSFHGALPKRRQIVTKLLIAATAATLLAAPALADDRQTVFERDGQTYAYTTTVAEEGTVIEGRTVPQNVPFRLVVRGRNAAGRVDGRPVSFRIAQPLVAPATATGVSLAAN
jgi:hypothetical protein